jgi:hypothetical protein
MRNIRQNAPVETRRTFLAFPVSTVNLTQAVDNFTSN